MGDARATSRSASERVTGTDQNDSFEVIVTAFEPRDDSPEQRLQRVFGLPHELAAKLLSSLPATVQRRVPRVRAEYFRRALLKIGASVEVRDGSGALVPPQAQPSSAPPPRRPSAPAAAASAVPPSAALPGASAADRAVLARGMADTVVDLRPPPGVVEAAAVPPASALWPEVPAAAYEAGAMPNATLREAVAAPAVTTGAALDGGVRAMSGPTVLSAAQASPVAPAVGGMRAMAGPTVFSSAQAPASAVAPASLGEWSPPAPGPEALEIARSERPPAANHSGVDEESAPLRRPSFPSAVWDAVQPAAGEPRAAAPAPAAPPVASPRAAEPAAGGRQPHVPITLDPSDAASAPLDFLTKWEPPAADDLGLAAVSPSPAVAAAPAHAAAHAAPAPGATAPALASSPPVAKHTPARARAPRAPGPARPVAVGIAERRAPEPAFRADRRSFWETLPEALALPFTGTGLYWVIAISIWSVAVGILLIPCFFVPLIGSFVAFFANASLLALAVDYFRVCFWVPAVSERVVDRSPDFDPGRIFNVYVKSGAHLMAFALASQIPLIYFAIDMLGDGDSVLDVARDPVMWLLALLPGYVWPAAITMTALHNDFSAVWSLRGAVSAVVRAPVEYTVAMLFGAGAFAVTWVALLLFGSMLGVSGILLSGTMGLPLAVSHGVLGSLLGHLARARPETFD